MTFIIIAANIVLILHRKGVLEFKKALFISIYLLMGMEFTKKRRKSLRERKIFTNFANIKQTRVNF